MINAMQTRSHFWLQWRLQFDASSALAVRRVAHAHSAARKVKQDMKK